MKLAGLIALSDPPRPDSAGLVSELHGLGVRTVMVTGDAPATAAIVAKAVGLDGAICPPGPIPDAVHPEQFAVFAVQGFVGTMSGVGASLSTTLSGLVAGSLGRAAGFLGIAVVALAAVLLLWLLMPESNPPQGRTPTTTFLRRR